MASPFDRVGGVSTTATGEQLGTAGFTIFADAGNFFDTLGKAETAARRTGQGIGNAFGKGSQAAMGLMQFGQMVDDMQYGFRAIVNNIPQVGMAIGRGLGYGIEQSATFAGVIGIAAVAVNQLVNHWEGLQRAFSDKTGIDAAKSNLEAFAEWLRSSNVLGPGGGAALVNVFGNNPEPGKQAALDAGAAAGQAGIKAAMNARSEEQKRLGEAFARAMAEYGGERLFNEVLAKHIGGRNLTPNQIEFAKQQVGEQIHQAMQGKMAPANFGGFFGDALAGVFKGQQEEKNRKARDEARAMFDDANRKDAERKDREARELAKAEADDALAAKEMEIHEMEKDLHWRQQRLARGGDESRVMGGKQFADTILTDAFNSKRNRQVEQLERANQHLQEMKEILRRDRQAARFAR